MRVPRVLLLVVSFAVLTACETMETMPDRWGATGVTIRQRAEIREAIRALTLSPITHCHRSWDPSTILVETKDGKSYQARKIKGKWHFKESFIIYSWSADDLTRRCS
jgi:hypothetical protein